MKTKDIKILFIGNSFAADTIDHMARIAHDLGAEPFRGAWLYIGGCSIHRHYHNAQNDLAEYDFYSYIDHGQIKVKEEGYTIERGLRQDAWDYVVIQHGTGDRSRYTSPESYEDLPALVRYVKERVAQDTKIVFNMAWVADPESTHHEITSYGGNQDLMYRKLTALTKNLVAAVEGVDIVCPTGTAVQNARERISKPLTRDGFHLSYDLGRYIAGLTFLKAVCGLDTDRVNWCPEGVTEEEREVAKQAANKAATIPYAVSMDEELPIYWKTRLEDVEAACALVKKGCVTVPCVSAGGRPIYCVEYGKSTLPPPKANLSSALGARDIRYYADKTAPDYIPTVFLCGCVHGGEFEGTAAMLNLIKLLETGTDYAGNPNDALVAACEKVHLILVPVANPDGRSHIPFDSFVGRSLYDLRYYNQGTWHDDTLCGWPGCKILHPIKEHVNFLGGYFNDDGVNMMHEDFIGGKLSTGTQLVLDICKRNAPDFSILLHGGANSRMHILPPDYSAGNVKREIEVFGQQLEALHMAEGIGYHHIPMRSEESNANPPSFNLVSAMHHCCGESAITYESNQGLCDANPPGFTYDQIYRSHMLLFEHTATFVTNKYAPKNL